MIGPTWQLGIDWPVSNLCDFVNKTEEKTDFVDTCQQVGQRTTYWNESWLCQTRDTFPLPLFQEMSRYENHIETGLGTKNGLFEVYPDYM
jgi:hypothetical protein